MYRQSNRLCTFRTLSLAASMSACFGGAAVAAPTVLDFEDLPAGTAVTTQYGVKGVVFENHFLDTHPAAHSGTRVLRSASLSAEIFNPIPIAMTFTSPQARVKLFAASTGISLNGTLTAFDAGNNVVVQDGPKPVAADVFSAVFEVIDPDTTPSIARAELRLENGIYFAIDDLEFDGEPPAPTPTAPVVQITSPPNGVNLDILTMDITGTVTGEGLISPVKLTVLFARPPGSTAPPFTSDLALTGTGTTRQFALLGFTGVPLGPITVTVTAQNFGAQEGSASVTFTNLPAAIAARFTAEGGATTFGAFRFGGRGECTVAVYERGAISLKNGATFVIRGDILTKWLSLRTLANPDGLGCPTAEERMTFLGDATVQEFEKGRIYRSLALPGRAAFVPEVFAKVFRERGEELKIGVPVSDPTESSGPQSQTWLFQQFFRADKPGMLQSTMEIRGNPPVLYLERQGGDWLHPTMEPSLFDLDRNKSAATIWESFPCGDLQGPCTVGPDPNSAPQFPPPNTPNIGNLFCNSLLYVPTLEGFCFPLCSPEDCPGCPPGDADCCCCIPTEWEPVRGQYDATPVFGAIVSAHMADIDNGFTHETHNGNCPYIPDLAQAVTDVTCVSDFEFFVLPVGPQIDTSPLPSLFGKKNTTRIKTEYEVAYAAEAHNFLGNPAVGDLVHTTGRWIVDCGHDTYKTELHPIFSFARMKTVVSETNAFTKLEDDLGIGGKPATRVAIWVNGWYPGGEGNAIEFDVFPPPRPNPDARLHVIKPVDFAAGGYRAAEDVSMEFKLLPPGIANHVHLRFTAPRRENTVTAAGEYKFESGRQYWGIWYLYWGD